MFLMNLRGCLVTAKLSIRDSNYFSDNMTVESLLTLKMRFGGSKSKQNSVEPDQVMEN